MGLSIHSDEHFMKEALKQAKLAYEQGEIPVGAVVVANKQIIAKAYNQTEVLNDPTAHAEMLAITSACNYLGTKYLNECTLYVTLEPCGMCGGALYWSQLGKLVYAASDEKRGFSTLNKKIIHPKTKISHGLMADEAGALVTQFFQRLRES
ncbi:nucleoside deaminase [Fulvivirga lutea]|uniref:tRNA-specific adenosine deaminase n=1 Tax=Fulvivirga lutea TaxID=2810512 RepID=A0A975A2L8_9BACT|nr:nucleoside deaminase [Fulvivirga lutea]QSE98981.1 nucleoside deaminase [Fulvivirga lutea]